MRSFVNVSIVVALSGCQNPLQGVDAGGPDAAVLASDLPARYPCVPGTQVECGHCAPGATGYCAPAGASVCLLDGTFGPCDFSRSPDWDSGMFPDVPVPDGPDVQPTVLPAAPQRCVPGATTWCRCAAFIEGAQACGADGHWDPCVCAALDAAVSDAG